MGPLLAWLNLDFMVMQLMRKVWRMRGTGFVPMYSVHDYQGQNCISKPVFDKLQGITDSLMP
jgi:hypothetical protein